MTNQSSNVETGYVDLFKEYQKTHKFTTPAPYNVDLVQFWQDSYEGAVQTYERFLRLTAQVLGISYPCEPIYLLEEMKRLKDA